MILDSHKISNIRETALTKLDAAETSQSIEAWRVDYIGRKGIIGELFRGISSLTEEQRQAVGAELNRLKKTLEESLSEKLALLDGASSTNANSDFEFDVTLPGRPVKQGTFHPTTLIIQEISEIFRSMGFQCFDGPEIELDTYNFQKLNIPADHPARDMWNSLWIDRKSQDGSFPLLMRTHTSPMQIRIMENHEPPIRVIVPGKAYRYEATDATHEWQFCQIEGLAVDRDITFADLKGTLEEFAKRIFGEDRKARFRCDFFPFVEPGAEMAIDCFICDGKGCPTCKNTGWIEIMGAGMVHPNVLSGVGYDPDKYTGFAFGLGAERIAMLKHQIEDVRLFYSNDLRFLKQFRQQV